MNTTDSPAIRQSQIKKVVDAVNELTTIRQHIDLTEAALEADNLTPSARRVLKAALADLDEKLFYARQKLKLTR